MKAVHPVNAPALPPCRPTSLPPSREPSHPAVMQPRAENRVLRDGRTPPTACSLRWTTHAPSRYLYHTCAVALAGAEAGRGRDGCDGGGQVRLTLAEQAAPRHLTSGGAAASGRSCNLPLTRGMSSGCAWWLVGGEAGAVRPSLFTVGLKAHNGRVLVGYFGGYRTVALESPVRGEIQNLQRISRNIGNHTGFGKFLSFEFEVCDHSAFAIRCFDETDE